ncbi:MAG: calcium-binding protein [Gammaproteobacteria bacterium]|nr:calcium-binding protein [Gammaproteobacteria bacterium]
MATITYQNGITILPSIGDLAEVFNGLVVTSSNATKVVLENAFGKITLNAALVPNQFAYGSYGEYPVSGNIESVSVQVYSAAGTLANFASFAYGASPLAVTSVLNPTYYGYGIAFNAESLFIQADTVNGTAAADWMHGRSGNDTMSGAGGDDTLDGGAGNDSLAGGAGDDVYILDNALDVVVEGAGAGNDTVALGVNGYAAFTYTLTNNVENAEINPAWAVGTNSYYYYYPVTITGNELGNIMRGGTGSDYFKGMAGNDRLFGGDGNDTLDGGTGNDIMSGGHGNDTYYVDAVGDKVFEYPVNSAIDLVISSISYTLGAHVENLQLAGTANLKGTGNALDNRIIANSGNNVLKGLDGIDTLSYETATTKVTASLNTAAAQITGGSGTDAISGFENLVGGSAGDNLKGSAAANRIDGGLGADTMTGLGGNDTYVVDVAGDKVVEAAGAGLDTVESAISYTLGNNLENLTLTGSAVINGTGNALDNLIIGNSAANLLIGAAGNDTLRGGYNYDNDTLNGGAGNDSLDGGYGNDSLLGGDGIDTLDGGYGDDILDGGLGADSMSGGGGNDTFYVNNAGDLVFDVADYGSETNTVITTIDYTLGANIDNLVLTDAATRGAGNYQDNVITANGNNNVLNGGRGIDTLSYAGTTGAVTVSLALAGAQATGGSGNDALRNFENLTGGSGNDSLTGSSLGNVLDGGAGNDTMAGGKGDDTYIVNSTSDVIIEAASSGVDQVLAAVTFTLAVNVENLTLTGTATINGTGNAAANTIIGNTANNELIGAGGNDTLSGGLGIDTLNGGLGNDTYRIDTATDVIIDSGGIDTIIVEGYSIYTNYLMPTGIENIDLSSYYSYYAISATGNALNNRMIGNASNNTLIGDAGNDTLIGGAGYDNLTGGAGNDVFVFDAPLYNADSLATTTGYDTITDFTVGADKIQLDDDIFTALPVVASGVLGAAHLQIGAAATDADDRIIYNSVTGALYYDQDGNGAQAQTQFALLGTGLALTVADFAII